MKKIITTLVMAGAFSVQAQVLQTGPSTSVTPYMWPAVNGASVISILSSGESVNGYSLCDPGDGMGYLDNGSSTFTVNHNVEISYPNGSLNAIGTIDVGLNTVSSTVNAWVYPNPAQNFITLKLENHEDNVQISITNLLGEVLYHTTVVSGLNEVQINTHSMVSGMYLVKIKQDSGYTIQNLIISK
jgi:hypothetical protein